MEAYIEHMVVAKGVKGSRDGDVILFAAEDLCQVLRITPPSDILLPHMTVTYFIYHLLPRCQIDESSDAAAVAYTMRSVFTKSRPEKLTRRQLRPPAPAPVPIYRHVWKIGQNADHFKITLAAYGIAIDLAPDGTEWFEVEALIALPQYRALREPLSHIQALKTDIGTHLVQVNAVLNNIANYARMHIHCQGKWFPKMRLGDPFYMIEFLRKHPLTLYNAATNTFALAGLIRIFKDDDDFMDKVTLFFLTMSTVVTWDAFCMKWIPKILDGPLARAWWQTIVKMSSHMHMKF